MLAQMKCQAVARDLHVDLKVGLKTMLPIDLETEKIEIELAGLVDRENAQDGHNAAELDGHSVLLAVGGRLPNPASEPIPSCFGAPSGGAPYRPAAETSHGRSD